MGNESLDDLIRALRTALVAAQDAVRKRREEAVRRMCEVDETGAPRSSFFTFAVPRNVADKDEYEMVSLPASSFRAQHRHQISMLSLEFECRLTEKKLSGGSRSCSLEIKAGGKGGRRWKNRRLMRIVFHGTDQPSGEVWLDGELFMDIPPCGDAGSVRPKTGAKRSKFRILLDRLRNLWRGRKFVLTEEQAERARKILEQPETGAPVTGGVGKSKKTTFSS